MDNSHLELAISLAVEGHRGQVDKVGAAYILHPLRVMQKQKTIPGMIVGVLHDWIEDCNGTPNHLYSLGFTVEIVESILCLTKRPGETYEHFIDRVLDGPALAKPVKISDVEDNSDRSRIVDPKEEDFARWAKYERALARLRA
ncbi:GTP pyrophosphokinase [Candidatus Uhrbacteria bacterium]|nr:GTP pyrophosphokinase [Candidatus Uhrbacteria bacterium]